MGESEIIELIRARDERGAEELLRHFGALLRYVIAPILPDERDREDCLSEVLMRIWDGIGGFDPARGSWRAYITAAAAQRGAQPRAGSARSRVPTGRPRRPARPRGGRHRRGGDRRAAPRHSRPPARRTCAHIPQVLLSPTHGADSLGAGPQPPGRGGAALPHQEAPRRRAGR